MKTVRFKQNFSPASADNFKIVVLANTDYDVVDTNQAFGLNIKIITTVYSNNALGYILCYISPEELDKFELKQQRLEYATLLKILKNITFGVSCINFNWGWEICEVNGTFNSYTDETITNSRGFLINTTFTRPDILTGELGIGKGRRMWIEDTASETSIVMTAWVCVELIIKHESMEGFTYRGAKLLNPHKNIEQLAYPSALKETK